MGDDGGESSSFVAGLIENRAKEVVFARGCFDDTKVDPGFSDRCCIHTKLGAEEPLALGLDTYYKQHYLSLAAAAATIKWIEAEKGVIVSNHSLNVTFNGSFDHMNIDATSVKNLEIIDPFHNALLGTSNKKRSLFQMLHTTKTVGGTRLLRANLLQPLKDIETINTRLDCLDELMSHEQLFFGLSQFLRKFPKETVRVLCHFCSKTKKVKEAVLCFDNTRKSQNMISSIMLLKTALDALPLLAKVLKDANCFLLTNAYKSVCENDRYASIRKKIEEVIDDDILHARVPFVACTQQCFALKAGIDGFLDIATFCDTSEAIHNLASKYREEFNLPPPFNNRQGFFFRIPQKEVQGKLPSKFTQQLPKTRDGSSTEDEENKKWNDNFLKERGTNIRVKKEINETEPCSKIFYLEYMLPQKEKYMLPKKEKYMFWEVAEKTPSEETFAENWKRPSGSVRDQRSHDNCWTYTGTDVFSAWRLINKKDDEFRTFSARYLTFYASKMLRWVESDEGKRKKTHHCHGYTIDKTLKFIKENGVPEEDPADAEKDFSCITDAPEEYPSNMYKIPEEVDVRVSNKLEDLYDMLLHHPVAAEMHCFSPEFRVIGSDVYEGSKSQESRYRGLHTVLITRVKRSKGKLVAIVKSSHGKSKGKKGYIKVSLTKMVLGIGRGNEITSPSFLLTNFTCLEIPRPLNKPKSEKEEKKEKKKRKLGSCRLPFIADIDPETSVQLLQLLVEASSQDKKFECEEADKALNRMVNSVAKAAVFTSKCVSKMELSEIEEFGMVLILQMAADLLTDKLPEARKAARSMKKTNMGTNKKLGRSFVKRM